MGNWPFENHLYRKSKTSFILGSTPEFDMALFTVCFLKHPNSVSKFKINGTTFMVQTWKNQDGTLGSAYSLCLSVCLSLSFYFHRGNHCVSCNAFTWTFYKAHYK